MAGIIYDSSNYLYDSQMRLQGYTTVAVGSQYWQIFLEIFQRCMAHLPNKKATLSAIQDGTYICQGVPYDAGFYWFVILDRTPEAMGQVDKVIRVHGIYLDRGYDTGDQSLLGAVDVACSQGAKALCFIQPDQPLAARLRYFSCKEDWVDGLLRVDPFMHKVTMAERIRRLDRFNPADTVYSSRAKIHTRHDSRNHPYSSSDKRY